jgi:hypothetical protein
VAWQLTDEDMLNSVSAETAPPTDLEGLLSSDLWASVFSAWATDLGYQQGDYTASTLHRVWIDLAYSTPGETIYAQYVEPSSGSALPWPTSVFDRFERVANGMDSDYAGALAETHAAVTEMLEPYASMFRDDIFELQSQHPSEPTPIEITLSQIDMGTVDSINQAVLKDLPEFNKDPAGSRVTFYANTEVVLIGDNHPGTYYQYLYDRGHTVGTVTMMRRGSAFSAGRLEVGLVEVIQPGGGSRVGVLPSQDEVRQAVTDAIGRVSNKEVRHNK